MAIREIGLLSPGDMGHAVGATLKANGLPVLTCLAGRSERSRQLAEAAGLVEVPSLEALVDSVDVLLSILVPARAVEVAEQVAAAVRARRVDLLYCDLNAVAPRTARQIGEIVQAAGARYADGGIIGSPPRAAPGTKASTHFFVSGTQAEPLLELNDYGLDLRLVGDEIGQASGLKMCYAALTKGLQALGLELLVAARLMGLEAALEAEQREGGTGQLLRYLEAAIPSMPPKAYRWVGEMEEIATTFADLGLTPRMLLGSADLYELVAASPIGRETPETRDRSRDLAGVVSALADSLAARPAALP